MVSDNTPASNERYCTSCGSIIKEKAELCTDCGVRNDIATGMQSGGSFYCVSCGGELRENAQRCPDCGYDYDSVSTPGMSAVDVITWIVGIFLILAGIGTFGEAGNAIVNIGTGVVYLAAGIVLLPPIRENLSKNHPLTTFGTIQGVDRHDVQSYGESCTSCGQALHDGGTVSHYYEEFVLFGFTLRRTEGGRNAYCQTCALTQLNSGPGVGQEGHGAVQVTESE